MVDRERTADKSPIVRSREGTYEIGVQLLQGVCIQVGNPLSGDASAKSVFSSLSKKRLYTLRAGRVDSPRLVVGGYEFLRLVEHE